MKPCPQCDKVGELLTAEYLVIGDGAIQTLDTGLKCDEHGEYEGNWSPEQAKALLPPPVEGLDESDLVPTLEEYVAAGYAAENYERAFGGRTPNTPAAQAS